MKTIITLIVVVGSAWGIYYHQTGGGNLFDFFTKPGGKSFEEHIESADQAASEYGSATDRRLEAEFGPTEPVEEETSTEGWEVQRD